MASHQPDPNDPLTEGFFPRHAQFSLLLAFGTVVFFSLLSTTADWVLGQQPKTDPHDMANFEVLANTIHTAAPGCSELGYVTDQSAEAYYKFQYALAPIWLRSGTDAPATLGYFKSSSPAAIADTIRQRGLRVKSDLGQGLYILVR